MTRRRQVFVVGGAVAALAMGAALVAIRFGSDPRTPSVQFAPQVLAAAPRECPAGPIRANRVEPEDIVSLMRSHLPTSLPTGFGVQSAYDGGDRKGVLWVDQRCRQIKLSFVPGRSSSPPDGPRVGAWVVTHSVPGGCGNAVLGTSRCLIYHAAAPDGGLVLQLMGFAVEEGNAIARSINVS